MKVRSAGLSLRRPSAMRSPRFMWLSRMRDKVRARLQPAASRLGAQWRGLSERERRQVVLLVIVVVAAAAWLLLVKPALDALRHWDQELPRLRSQAAALQKVLAETGIQQASAPSGKGSDDAVSRVRASLDAAGLGGTYTLTQEASALRITFKSVDARQLTHWLLALPPADLPITQATLARIDAPQDGAGTHISATVLANAPLQAGPAP